MKLWYKACPRCNGDLILDRDVQGTPYVHCLQCGRELNHLQVAGLLALGRVPITAKQPAPRVVAEGWRRHTRNAKSG